jgi:glyoxylase-like metal-dependent hydrolase (beta-lactamase superfamily II)
MTVPSWASLVRAPNPGPMTLDGTNSWVLRAPGSDSCVVVDPGPLLEPHLLEVAGYGPVAAVLVTHAHPDHVEGLERFRQLAGSPPVFGAESIGTWSYAGLSLQIIATPGHTVDSICVVAAPDRPIPADGGSAAWSPAASAVLTGDTVVGRGTTMVAWPDGSLGGYLDSLVLLGDLGPMAALTGHGPPLPDVSAAARSYLAHRRDRLEQVRQAVRAGARGPRQVLQAVYAEVPRELWFAAEQSVRAQLAYLVERGEA